jgi:delta14-sterol reductase
MDTPLLPITPRTLLEAAAIVLGFVGALFLGAILLPGLEREGYPQPNGERKPYKLVGMTLFFVTHMVLGVATFGFGVSLTPVLARFWSIFLVANALAVLFTLALYLHGRRAGAQKGEVGHDLPLPAWVKDLWFGNELNPTWLGVDLKMFTYHPSLIGVYLLNLSFAYAQYDRHGVITPQMGCYVAFWWAYLFTHYVKEEFMLSTWDILAENFGFMLVWGDLVYVPFLYSLPGWWIVDQTEPFGAARVAALAACFLFALWVFREANWQKERYKRNPAAPIWGKKPETVGGKLLVSGFWGIGRKINYTGEIGVYFTFAMCAGFGHLGPYLLPLSLFVLLVQRASRDDKKCRAKYGPLWVEYEKRARFRVIPFLY